MKLLKFNDEILRFDFLAFRIIRVFKNNGNFYFFIFKVLKIIANLIISFKVSGKYFFGARNKY